MDPDQPPVQEGIKAHLLVLGEREVVCDQRVSVQSGSERGEAHTSGHACSASLHTERHSGCDPDHRPRPGVVSIATHKFWDMILSISSQVWNILRPWTVFSVRDLKMTSSSGRST